MQLLEIIDYEPNTFGTDEEVVEIPKKIAKFSVEDAKNHPKRPYRLRTSPGRKGRKKKTSAPFFRRKKTVFPRKSCVFSWLPW
jgi:hypothetical protein